jgi:hypothetical protein
MLHDIFTHYANVPKDKMDLHEVFKLLDSETQPAALRDWALGRGFTRKEFESATRSFAQVEALGLKARTPEQFVTAFTARRGVTMSFDGMLQAPSAGLATEYTTASLINDVISFNYTLEAGFKESALRIEVERWSKTERDRALNEVWANIEVPNALACDAEWKELAGAILDATDDVATIEYCVGAFKSVIWQVKRKLKGLPVYDHLMVVLYGGQGSGKSEALKRILAALAGCVTVTNFAEAMDGRHIDLWASPVLFFDEMEKAGKSDMDAIKNAITAEKRSARVFHSQRSTTFRVMTTFVGTMNGRLGDKIRDATGLRRFAPIPVRSKSEEHPTGCDHEVINSTDFLALWNSVSADDPHPLPSTDLTLRAMQEREREITPLEYWVNHFDGWELGLRGKVGALFPNHARMNVVSFGRALAEFVGKPNSPFTGKSAGRDGTYYHLADQRDREPSKLPDITHPVLSSVRRAA